ncbi:hypothetical protein [Exiguobacterium sp. s192]|uniref:hypothetical protein n=1 Tax=Exiguobacterium sp. s192 TaxID=2751206 RepID=UPI001BEB6A30|nr:hypothetical protein [Exiguobacterium sp. s192]
MSDVTRYYEGPEETKVGYIFEKKTEVNAGSRHMVISIQSYSNYRGEVKKIAFLANAGQINSNICENRDYKLVGKLVFEELNL